MAQKFLPDNRKLSDYEGDDMTTDLVYRYYVIFAGRIVHDRFACSVFVCPLIVVKWTRFFICSLKELD